MIAVLWCLAFATTVAPLSSSPVSIPDLECSSNGLSISGGSISLSNGYKVNSLLTYNCPADHYAYPDLMLRCRTDGKWTPRPSRNAQCKVVTCPDPSVLRHGSVTPSQTQYFVHNVTHYQCYEGYQFRGNASRTCQSNGKWSGDTPICDSGTDHCPDPGVPPGTRRTGDRFGIDDKVSYRCDRGLILVGSSERMCLENQQWTGAEPACYYKYTYDSPEEAAKAFTSSLGNLLHESGQDIGDEQYGKKIRLDRGGKLNIYVAMDASQSLDEKEFEKSKACILALIQNISYFEVTPKYDILSFATFVKDIVNITEPQLSLDNVIKSITKFKYSEHRDQTGTNIAAAFHNIYEKMSFLSASNREEFKETRHVIILFSDGQANMGGSADVYVRRITQLIHGLHSESDRESYLDIYAFSVGSDPQEEELLKLVSQKPEEKHFFKLENINDLHKTFALMIDESDSVGLCGLYRNYDVSGEADKTKREKFPWLVSIKITRSTVESCKGSLVSPLFVLTAAHCFRSGDRADQVTIEIDDNLQTSGDTVKKIVSVHIHPEYNIGAMADQGIPEFYDYDVALIQLSKPVKISRQARPICIPCTKDTSRALGLSGNVNCGKHGKELLNKEYEVSSFMTVEGTDVTRKQAKIKLLGQRDRCIKDALLSPNVTATDATKLVTERFLCSGGTEPTVDDMTCKGDSGGALFLERKQRLIQVGVISWGNKELCKSGGRKTKSDSRDYHINLFTVQPFLKKYLGEETDSLPRQLEFID
ncbi:complement factor B isoform X2 [Amia ocellicauda]|uniref:complement factor B isoform X1 n=1 Tax=Amia ocellicauda TaxID=2972642 RepID=UPI003464B506